MIREQLRSVWQSVLAVQEVNDSDNFFELGGDSSACLAVALQIEDEAGLFVDAALIYEYPVFESFAAAIEEIGRSSESETI